MTNKDDREDTAVGQGDDALFDALDKNKRKKRRRITAVAVSVLLVLAAVTVTGIFILQQRVQDAVASEQGEVLSAPVNVGAINAVVTGTGTLAEMDLEAITVPEGVEITQVPVQADQTVSRGDILATVDMTSVVNTLAQLQAQIEALDAQISSAGGNAVSTQICAGVSGRVKAVYGKVGDHVADVMVNSGALALLSLDGYMEVTVRSGTLTAGDSVSVVLSDGKTLPGSVESVSGSYAVVLVTDNGTVYGDKVKVFNTAGKEIGPGTLKIHSPLRVTGYAGTIASVKIAVEDKVTGNTRLFTLEDTDYSASYHTLLRKREELEQTVIALLTIQQDGAVLAAYDGGVYSVDHSDEAPTAVVTLSADDRMGVSVDVSESDILSLSIAQRATVSVPSVGSGTYTGMVMDVARSANASGSFSVLVELSKEEGMLPGMTANVSIRIRGEDGALTVPVEAVHKTRNGAYVYTSYDEQKQEFGGRRKVVTGLENSRYVEILSGIGIGDTVYYTKQQDDTAAAGEQNTDSGSSQVPDFSGSWW